MDHDRVAVDDPDDRVVGVLAGSASASFDFAVLASGTSGAGWAGCLTGALLGALPWGAAEQLRAVLWSSVGPKGYWPLGYLYR